MLSFYLPLYFYDIHLFEYRGLYFVFIQMYDLAKVMEELHHSE